MFYSYKLIENAGFKSAEEFVEYYFKRHKNCCFKHTPKGIFLDYDFDTDKIAYFGEGVCPICGEKLEHFDDDSQGGRGYCCPSTKHSYYTWVSWRCVDKNFGKL